MNRNKLLPEDAREYTVEFDTLKEESLERGTIRQELIQNTSVVWARQIPAEPDQTLVSVAGAGARLKIYLAEDGSVMGGIGNWRQIEPAGRIPVNDSEKTWSLFERYGEKVAIEPALVLYDQAVPNYKTALQLYYEFTSDNRQAELIPCWLFEVSYYQKGELMLVGETFIPAETSYVPPIVTIVKPTAFETFQEGDMIGFDCQVEDGFGTKPYTFLWESSVNSVLSSQQTFDTDALNVHCPDIAMACDPLPHTITVTVTDAKGLQSSDSIQITVNGPCTECRDPADLNGDKVVDLSDFAYWASRFLMQSGYPEK